MIRVPQKRPYDPFDVEAETVYFPAKHEGLVKFIGEVIIYTLVFCVMKFALGAPGWASVGFAMVMGKLAKNDIR